MSSNELENSRQNDSGSSGKVAAQRKRDVQHFRGNFISDKPNLMLRSCFETSNSMAILMRQKLKAENTETGN